MSIRPSNCSCDCGNLCKHFVTNVEAKTTILYGTIEISWKNPSLDFDEIVVFRKTNDFVETELDPYGKLIYRGTAEKIYDYSVSEMAVEDFNKVTKKVIGEYDSRNNQFINVIEDPLDGDTLYYYTVFVVTKGTYHASKTTTATARPNKNHGISERLYDYLPAFYKIEDKKFQLQRFLKVAGMMFDYLMTMAKNTQHFVNIDTCEPYQLQYIANLLDWDLDETLPVPSQRQSLKSALNVYRLAGTREGLDLLVKANSGFPATSGVMEGRDFNVYSVYFGVYPFDLIRYDYEATPNFSTLDPETIGKGGDPLKYTFDSRPDNKQQFEKFYAYVRKTSPLTQEQEELMRTRLEKLLTRFSPAGTKFELEIY